MTNVWPCALCPHDGNGCLGFKEINDCRHRVRGRAFHINDCAKRQRSMAKHPEQYSGAQRESEAKPR